MTDCTLFAFKTPQSSLCVLVYVMVSVSGFHKAEPLVMWNKGLMVHIRSFIIVRTDKKSVESHCLFVWYVMKVIVDNQG